MYIKGKFQTENNLVKDFEFETKLADGLGGYHNCYGDFRIQIESVLTVDNQRLDNFDLLTDNLVNTVRFEKMFKNAVVTDIEELRIDEFDSDSLSYNVGFLVEINEEMQDWFLDKYGYQSLGPDTIGHDFDWYIDESICCTTDLHYLLDSAYELSNNWRDNQWNNIAQGCFDMIYSEYEEENEDL